MTRPSPRREFIAPTPRTRMTRVRRVSIFIARNGKCWRCRNQIRDGEKWIVEHPDALVFGGSDNDDDLWPAHVRCGIEKTKEDQAALAKRNRIIDANYAKPERRQSRFKRKMSGEVVDRATNAPIGRHR